MGMLHGRVNRKAIHTLIQRGEDVNGRNKRGETPLIAAVNYHSVEAVSVLLDYEAEINAKDRDGKTALLHAALWHYPDVLRLLLARGADAQVRSHAGVTALMLAAWPEDFEWNRGEDVSTIALLLEAGVEINARDEEGGTALHHLAQDYFHKSGHDEVARLLIAAGADVSLEDKSGQTAWSYAEENNREALAAVLHQAASNAARMNKEKRGG